MRDVAFCNLSFSCELYIKTLLLTEQKNIRGHKLNSLFCKLSQSKKDEFFSFFKDEMDAEKFYLQLNEVSSAFEVIRYIYEYKEMVINALFIFQLAGCLREMVKITMNSKYMTI